MPMPPPNPTTDGRSDPRTQQEVQQILRALRVDGPLGRVDLETVVGARFWDAGRFEAALAIGVAEGLVRRSSDGTLAAS